MYVKTTVSITTVNSISYDSHLYINLTFWWNAYFKNSFSASFFQKDQDGAIHKAALLSGPPGVGKTTTAVIVCKELGYSYVEMNASDSRNKKSLDEHVSQLLSNKSMDAFVGGMWVNNV